MENRFNVIKKVYDVSYFGNKTQLELISLVLYSYMGYWLGDDGARRRDKTQGESGLQLLLTFLRAGCRGRGRSRRDA